MSGPAHTTPADDNLFEVLGFKEPEASQLLAEANARLDELRKPCKVNLISSRMCEKGTRGCVVSHGEDDGKEYQTR